MKAGTHATLRADDGNVVSRRFRGVAWLMKNRILAERRG
jgi:hypothetical protein